MIKELLESIRFCEGEIINITQDHNQINDDFLFIIQNQLKNDYNIIIFEDELSMENIEKIGGKNLIILYFDKIKLPNFNNSGLLARSKFLMSFFRGYNTHKNYNILLLITNSYSVFSQISTYSLSNLNPLAYCASMIIQLENKKFQILKSRHSSNFQIVGKISEINSLVRKEKLIKINNN